MISAVIGDKEFEPDGYLHFLQAKTIFTNYPDNLEIGIDVWAKPLYTYIHGLWLLLFNDPKLIDDKLFNIIIFAFISFITFLIARKLKFSYLDSSAAAIISNIGFLSLRSSITTLTEPIFTLLFMLSIYAWVKDRRNLSAFILGIAVLGRLEALLFVGVWGLFELYRNYREKYINVFHYIFLLAPVIIWNAIGAARTGEILYLFSSGYPTETGVYGFGHPLTYIEGLAAQEGMLLAIALIGLVLYLKELEIDRKKLKLSLNKYIDEPMTFIIVVLAFFNVAQAVLYTFGLFGTAGLMRYFILIMPLFSLLAIKGLSRLEIKSKFWQLTFLSLFITFYGFGALSILRTGGFYKGLDNRPNVNQEFIDIWQDPALKDYKQNDKFVLVTNRPEIIYYGGYDLNQAAFVQEFNNIPINSLIVVDENWLKASSQSISDISSQRDIKQVSTVNNYSDIYVFIK